jgi:hypothetical protein
MSPEGGRRASKSLTLGDVGHFSGGPPIEAVRQMVDERVLIGAVEPPGGHRLCCIAVRCALVLSPLGMDTDKINQILTNCLLEDDRDPSMSLQSQAR